MAARKTSKKSTTSRRKAVKKPVVKKPAAKKAASKKTVKKAAPKKPTRPKRASKPKASAPDLSGFPGKKPRSKGKLIKALEGSVAANENPELLKEIEALKATVAKQNTQLASFKEKAKRLPRNVRTVDQIIEEVNFGDWPKNLHEFHGAVINIYPFKPAKGSDYEADDRELEINTSRTLKDCLLAMPRDTDVGGFGAEERNKGMIAIHWRPGEERDEDGNPVVYHQGPTYVSYEELAEVWAD